PLARFMQVAVLLAVLGHMFPVWLRFRGGKGVATALGGFLFVDPIAVLICMGVFALVVGLTRYVSLASIAASLLFPLFLYGPGRPPISAVWPSALASLLIVLKHHQNIRRLIAGTESKFGEKKTPTPQEVEKQA